MLEIKDLCVNYGSVEALHHINLKLGANEIVALIGSNGAGKSTTLKAISGELKPTHGDVLFCGKSIKNKKVHEISKMGIVHVPEGRCIFSKLSVRENLMMGAYTQNDKALIKSNFEKVLEIFPILKERIKQQGGTLSGGEQQMLAFGRALMANPKVLLFDEPSLGLAPIIVDLIAENIAKIGKSGIPILLVEQNANIALEISQRAYVIETGSIELSGNSADLRNDGMIQKTYLGIS